MNASSKEAKFACYEIPTFNNPHPVSIRVHLCFETPPQVTTNGQTKIFFVDYQGLTQRTSDCFNSPAAIFPQFRSDFFNVTLCPSGTSR
jgi:hypothetical protein